MNGRAVVISLLAVFAFTGAQAQAPRQESKRSWENKELSPDKRADLVLAEMTLDEKVQLLHGLGWASLFKAPTSEPGVRSRMGAGFVPGIERLGLPDIQMSDAAVGVARSAMNGRYSTALPSAVAEAATWDPGIAYDYGAVIGSELRAQGFNMSLGGGVDLTREPRNGRTFEYKGEDPILAGTLVGQEMRGEQDQHVIGDIKHYAINDSEAGRNFSNSVISKRAMQESDLLAFQIGIRDSNAGAVMCSYNQINGNYACENDYTLNQVLKKEWGYKGFVVSDWGGTHSTVKAALAGLDMEMPGDTYFGEPLKQAVLAGKIPQAQLDSMVHRILRTEFATGIVDYPMHTSVVDVQHGMDVAQRTEEQGAVLLKNAAQQLPLDASRIRSIAVIGGHADAGVLSGGGSGQVDPAGGNAVHDPLEDSGDLMSIFKVKIWHRSSPLKAIRAKAPKATVEFNDGTDLEEAARVAKSADVAIVFAWQHESENIDLPNLSLPEKQDALIEAVAKANPHTIVVLETGGVVTMPWIDGVSAVLESWYPGIRGAEAITNILFGDVNPSGKTPLTFPKSEADLPHPVETLQPDGPLEDMPGLPGFKVNTRVFDVHYNEGLKVGYKWYDAENKQPLFPFGFGLSYTTFAYSDLKATPGKSLKVSFKVTNTGSRAGSETAQVYITLPAAAQEPPKRLIGWQKVALAAGESRIVTVDAEPLYFSVYDEPHSKWEVVPGSYKVWAGSSSRDLPLSEDISFNAN